MSSLSIVLAKRLGKGWATVWIGACDGVLVLAQPNLEIEAVVRWSGFAWRSIIPWSLKLSKTQHLIIKKFTDHDV